MFEFAEEEAELVSPVAEEALPTLKCRRVAVRRSPIRASLFGSHPLAQSSWGQATALVDKREKVSQPVAIYLFGGGEGVLIVLQNKYCHLSNMMVILSLGK